MSQEAIPLPQSAKRGSHSCLKGLGRKAMADLPLAREELAGLFEERRSNLNPPLGRKKPVSSATSPQRKKSGRPGRPETPDQENYKAVQFNRRKCGESLSPHCESEVSARFLKFGSDTLLDEDLLEHILCRARGDFDAKLLAKGLIAEFGSFAEVVAARPGRLQKFANLDVKVVWEIKMIEAAARRMAKSTIEKRPALGNLRSVIDYCRTAMAFLEREEFRVLFLDKKNMLISDEVHGIGTVDQAAVYPREIIRRALELSASGIILAHNHPSGDPEPSTDDIYLTHQIIAVAKLINVEVHDHIIIGRHGHISLKNRRLI